MVFVRVITLENQRRAKLINPTTRAKVRILEKSRMPVSPSQVQTEASVI